VVRATSQRWTSWHESIRPRAPSSIHSEDAVRDQQVAFEGRRGALLLAVSADDGSQLAEYRLDC
jgi:hypothetical protein